MSVLTSSQIWHCVGEDIGGGGGCFLERLRGQVGVTLRHRWIRMSENLLHFEKRSVIGYEIRRKGMPQVMDSEMWQSSFPTQTIPDFMNRCVRFPGSGVHPQMVISTFCIKLIQYRERGFIQGYGTHFL